MRTGSACVTFPSVSEADIALVQRNSAAFSARDVDGMLRCYAPDAVVVDRRRFGFGSFTGHAELRTYYEGIVGSAADLHEEMRILEARDGLVVADCELSGHLATDPAGPLVSAPYGLVITLRDGLIARLEVYDDGEGALEASRGG